MNDGQTIAIETDDGTREFPEATGIEIQPVVGNNAAVFRVYDGEETLTVYMVDTVEAITIPVAQQTATVTVSRLAVNCPDCRKSFKDIDNLTRHLFHSGDHDYSAKKKTTCEHCGNKFTFYPRPSENRNRGTYCSKECHSQSKAESALEIVECEECGKFFEAREHENRKYCSMNCVHGNGEIGAAITGD